MVTIAPLYNEFAELTVAGLPAVPLTAVITEGATVIVISLVAEPPVPMQVTA
jgi:hypothetical protein